MNNLLVLSRENAGAEAILSFDKDLKHLTDLIQSQDRTSVLAAVRVFASLSKNSFKRAEYIHQKLGVKPLARCLAMDDKEIPANTSILISNMILSICDLETRRKIRKPINVAFNFEPSVIEFINDMFRMFADLIDEKNCPGVGRDCCLDLVVKYVDRANGCNWTQKFIITGLPKLLRVAATVPELNEPGKKTIPAD